MKWKIAGCLALAVVAIGAIAIIRSLNELGDMLDGIV